MQLVRCARLAEPNRRLLEHQNRDRQRMSSSHYIQGPDPQAWAHRRRQRPHPSHWHPRIPYHPHHNLRLNPRMSERQTPPSEGGPAQQKEAPPTSSAQVPGLPQVSATRLSGKHRGKTNMPVGFKVLAAIALATVAFAGIRQVQESRLLLFSRSRSC